MRCCCFRVSPRTLIEGRQAVDVISRYTTREKFMKVRMLLLSMAVLGVAAAMPAAAQTTLNVVSAGDQNMVDYVNNYLGPKFEQMNPGVKVRAVGTGPGDSGSQKIYEKLSAQQKAGSATWDVDVAVVHQRGAATMVGEKLLMPYRNDIAAGKLVSRDTAKNALGANVDGYVLPMFHSQIAFAYNPDLVKAPPKSFSELSEWVKKNPKQFGYNGVKGGMSGVGFVTAWVAANSGMGDKLEKGPYDPAAKATIEKSLAGLKDFNQYVVMTPGNAGTLDMLNRGEIAIGPVWVDMFYTWMADGKMNPKVKLALPSPGLPGQPMYYVIPAKAANAAMAKKFIDLAESPEVQADGIVKQFNWYPGIDPQYVQSRMEPAAWNKLFTDISPADLSKNGRPFPLSEYFTDIVEGYERVVLK
jgi:putative spermidine/putrescine transport system substrate-binding protein